MEYSLFRTSGKYTFYMIESARPRALNMLKKNRFSDTFDYLQSADGLKKGF